MTVFTPSQLNEAAFSGKAAMEKCDLAYEASLFAAAQQIAQKSDERPIILLSGPSGSGKTTTSHKLEKYLDNMGHEAHTVSMDNYFYRRADGVVPLDEHGNHDYESPDNLDIELFAQHTKMMAECRHVDMPTFDFANQRRAKETIPIKRKKGEIIIFEGIHALNPNILSDHSFSQRVYVFPDAAIETGEGVISQQLIRLLRRLMRDKVHRGSSFADTLNKFESVCRGERLFIDPYKNDVDITINTFLPYELNVYSSVLCQELKKQDYSLLQKTGADKALSLLEQLEPIPVEAVSKDALIQEFLAL